MKSLADVLLSDEHRNRVIQECAQLFESHIQSIGGLKGMGVKTVWSAIRAAKPDLAERAATRMLPDVANALQPLFDQFSQQGKGDFGSFLAQHAKVAGDKILAIAEAKAAASDSSAVRSGFSKFKGVAEQEFQTVAPKLGAILAKYL